MEKQDMKMLTELAQRGFRYVKGVHHDEIEKHETCERYHIGHEGSVRFYQYGGWTVFRIGKRGLRQIRRTFGVVE